MGMQLLIAITVSSVITFLVTAWFFKRKSLQQLGANPLNIGQQLDQMAVGDFSESVAANNNPLSIFSKVQNLNRSLMLLQSEIIQFKLASEPANVDLNRIDFKPTSVGNYASMLNHMVAGIMHQVGQRKTDQAQNKQQLEDFTAGLVQVAAMFERGDGLAQMNIQQYPQHLHAAAECINRQLAILLAEKVAANACIEALNQGDFSVIQKHHTQSQPVSVEDRLIDKY
jgi:hypothetical protein